MKYRIRLFIAVAISIHLFSCADSGSPIVPEETRNVPAVIGKLQGTWKNSDGIQFEKWTRINDSSFVAVVFSIQGTDTVRSEEAIIYPEHEKWVFENKVRGQNEGKPVKFVSTILTDTEVQFSDPEHDFPTDVHYSITGHAAMRAYIIGPGKNGGKDTIYFNYSRVKE